MTLFEALIVAHLFGDYLFQTEYEAMNKAEGSVWNKALMAHCVKYTLCCLPVLLIYEVPLMWLLFILVTHIFFDRRWPIVWWRIHIMRGDPDSIDKTFWLTIVVDQIFHLCVLAIVVCVSQGIIEMMP
jgi:hypothetical protein